MANVLGVTLQLLTIGSSDDERIAMIGHPIVEVILDAPGTQLSDSLIIGATGVAADLVVPRLVCIEDHQPYRSDARRCLVASSLQVSQSWELCTTHT